MKPTERVLIESILEGALDLQRKIDSLVRNGRKFEAIDAEIAGICEGWGIDLAAIDTAIWDIVNGIEANDEEEVR